VERFCTGEGKRVVKKARATSYQWVDVLGGGQKKDVLQTLETMDATFGIIQSSKESFCKMDIQVRVNGSEQSLARFNFCGEEEACDYHNYLSNLRMLQKAIAAMVRLD